mmetsp:Transcript_10702/g.14869  ORF Transcript_10702/g.14869 Transcript_10702/m.14869 type:complete len:286 (-) Transcript_10702:143-1000(-)
MLALFFASAFFSKAYARWESPVHTLAARVNGQIASDAQIESNKKEFIWTYSHLPKTGGTMMRDLIPQVLDNYVIRNEYTTFSKSDFKANHFRVSTIRSPCDYYRSLWTYGCEGLGQYKYDLDEMGYDMSKIYGKTAPYDGPEDLDRFTEWLKVANNTYTARVRESIKVPSHQEIGEAAENIHCWVRTENFYPDMKTCLHKYEDNGGKVNWDKFKSVVGETANSSPHDTCSSYFNEERRKLVMCNNQELFKWFKFDLNSCCTGAVTQEVMRSPSELAESFAQACSA